jgi:hypothetical protein
VRKARKRKRNCKIVRLKPDPPAAPPAPPEEAAEWAWGALAAGDPPPPGCARHLLRFTGPHEGVEYPIDPELIAALGDYIIQPLVELYGGCVVVLTVS